MLSLGLVFYSFITVSPLEKKWFIIKNANYNGYTKFILHFNHKITQYYGSYAICRVIFTV